MKKLLLLFVIIISSTFLFAQEEKVIETEFKVFGACGMCKARIEKAVKIDEVKSATWDKTTKMLAIVYEPTVTVDSLQKRIAAVGHDTDNYKADDEVYAALPKCCLYRAK